VNRSLRRLLAVTLTGLSVLAVVGLGIIATGRAAFVTTHGVSMNPVYYAGDLVVAARAPSYQVGQIVAYHRPGHHGAILHRIIGGDAHGFLLKGDNNPSNDPTRPTASQLVGRAVLHIPHGGLVLHHLTSPTGLGLITFALLASGSTAVQTRRNRRRGTVSRHAVRRTGSIRSLSTLPPQLTTAAAAIAVVGVLGLALAMLAWTGPLDSSATTKTTADRQMTFSYTAAVGRTPAYDTTTASSPDPVFRKLADRVDVHFTYRGDPGSVSVAAELSTAGGWHSTVPLAAPSRIAGMHHQGTVRLDLKALEARAQAAAAVTGLPASPLNIAITTRIETAGGHAFQASLAMSLTPLQLALAGDAKGLTVTDSTTSTHLTRVPRTLDLLGRHLAVSTARTGSASLLLGSLLSAAILVLLARRMAPVDEAGAIRSRYAHLLVPVHPLPPPADRPVIDVTTFATLAKLAERYGLLILHWSRSEGTTFIVQDEASTYRYRTGPGAAAQAGFPDTRT
jgi:signal peptidase I